MAKRKSFWLWLIAFLLTLLLAVYQRMSGPTYPVRGRETVAGIQIKYKFLRSWTSGREMPVRVDTGGKGLALRLHYRRFPVLNGENWTLVEMEKTGGGFATTIPYQPPAGKVAYRVEIDAGGASTWLNNGLPVIARFKGKVPTALLIVHVVFMFAALLLAFRAGLEALRPGGRQQDLVPWTLGVTAFGGLILGPLVQKFAFGALWAGFPLGRDLTDNKILFAVLLWVVAFCLRRRSRWWTVGATLLMVAVYLIPHSMFGSELNYQTGKVETAKGISTPQFDKSH
jgi:hypothetical protein